MRYVVGLDIGGTNLVAGAVAEDGSEVLGLVSEPTRAEQGAEGVVGRLVKLARAAIAGARGKEVVGIGVGSPGPLNTTTGVVLLTPNLGWTNFPLRDRLAAALGLPATLDNDANCAIFGEWWRGAARGADHVVGLTIGTGIGGGIVLYGKIYHGASDIAGEIGHMTIDLNGRRCKCGNYGCLEAYASGPAIAARATEGIEAGADSALPRYVNGDLSRITAQLVYEAANDGDPYALDIVRETAKFLGAGVANIVNIFNPQVVVICGGVTLAGDTLFVPLWGEVQRRAFKPAVEACRVVPGALTGTAGVYGAAAVFMLRTWGNV
ncbi:MAG TPA: ROK family protein [Gemmatimonadales bacterium]|jgi:glucokinase|nr:ROK family protein [Gemmatimonadales bacterium]